MKLLRTTSRKTLVNSGLHQKLADASLNQSLQNGAGANGSKAAHLLQSMHFQWFANLKFSIQFARNVSNYVSDCQKSVCILEAGCGATPMPFWLGALGHFIVGVDLDLNCASKWHSQEIPCRPNPQNTRFMVGDMEQLPFSGDSFDIVY